jgi:protocatechuate 3,4-dioxygenase, beta subunit
MDRLTTPTSIKPYYRPPRDSQPPSLYEPYRSTVRRAPLKPLVVLPHTLSEITGPIYGHEKIGEKDNDLTAQHAGEPLGERIIVSGRVLDTNGRPVPNALIEVCIRLRSIRTSAVPAAP